MVTPELCLAKEEELIFLAVECRDLARKAELLQMAQDWRTAADGGPVEED